MKLKSKMYILLAIAMPVLFGVWLVLAIHSVDKEISNSTLNIDYNQKKALDVSSSGSNTYFIFKAVEYPNIRFERRYSGWITRLFIIPKHLKKSKPEKVNVWFDKDKADQLLLNTASAYNKCPFFAIQEREGSRKGIWYYYDICYYLKHKYFFLIFLYILAFAFVSGKGIDSQSLLFIPSVLLFSLWMFLFIFL